MILVLILTVSLSIAVTVLGDGGEWGVVDATTSAPGGFKPDVHEIIISFLPPKLRLWVLAYFQSIIWSKAIHKKLSIECMFKITQILKCSKKILIVSYWLIFFQYSSYCMKVFNDRIVTILKYYFHIKRWICAMFEWYILYINIFATI